MRGKLALPLVLALVGCKAQVEGQSSDGSVGDGSIDDDAAGDAAPLGPWGTPTKVTGASDPTIQEDDGTLSYSQLEIVFARQNAADNGRKDLYWASRTTPQGTFGTPIKLDLSLTGSAEETPRFSRDDLTLYFASNRGGGTLDIYSITRGATGTPFTGQGTTVLGVATGSLEKWFAPCGNNRYLVILGADVAEGTLPNPPTVVASLSTADTETGTFITEDCLTAYWASVTGGANTIYTSTRISPTDPWLPPTVVMDFAALGGEQSDPWISPDQRTFALTSDVTGNQNDIYISTR